MAPATTLSINSIVRENVLGLIAVAATLRLAILFHRPLLMTVHVSMNRAAAAQTQRHATILPALRLTAERVCILMNVVCVLVEQLVLEPFMLAAVILSQMDIVIV